MCKEIASHQHACFLIQFIQYTYFILTGKLRNSELHQRLIGKKHSLLNMSNPSQRRYSIDSVLAPKVKKEVK